MFQFLIIASLATLLSSSCVSDNWHGRRNHVRHEASLLNVTYMDFVPQMDPRGLINGHYHERKVAVVPQPARCMPELRTVKLRKSDDLSLHYIPSCTRVERCGGCCQQEEFFSCQPTESEIIKFKVSVSKYIGGTRYANLGKEIIKVERHVKCKCDCIVTAKDCNKLQQYVKRECKCICTNIDEKQKCLQDDNNMKFWDPSECSCRCLNVKDCTSGYTFNKHTCSCEPEQRQRIRGGLY